MSKIDSVVFQVTKKCDLCCAHCFFDSNSVKTQSLSLKTAKAALSDLPLFGFTTVNTFIITGGEPTIWPSLINFIKNIRLLYPKSKIRVDTNGLNFFEHPEYFSEIKADIYDISIDEFHDKSANSLLGQPKHIYVDRTGKSRLLELFIKNQKKFHYQTVVRWTSNRLDDKIFKKFWEKYRRRVMIVQKKVTATGRGRNLPTNFIGTGYTISERPENFTCLMGQAILLALDGCWYGCYHPVSLTRLGRAGQKETIKKYGILIKDKIYKKLPRQGLINFIGYIQKHNLSNSRLIEKILVKKYWYRCQPCEELCQEKIFKINKYA
jgi:sulfatase maturation enzyme AslB (radical SAM superfamily)